jgi:precorrin-6A synthase
MRKIYLIGMGAGDPEQITIQAIKALNQVDVFFFMDKGEAKQELVSLRKEICDRYVENKSYRIVETSDPTRDPDIADYTVRVEQWHHERSLIYERMISSELEENQCGAFLVWGDPSLYDSTLRIIDQIVLRAQISFDYEVIPGITSIQSLAARHRITLNGIGDSICIPTGRNLASGLAGQMDRVVVMLDGKCAFNKLSDPKDDLEIFWGAYLGMDDEILVRGKLSEAIPEITKKRAVARERKGWIMDTYLLSRLKKE